MRLKAVKDDANIDCDVWYLHIDGIENRDFYFYKEWKSTEYIVRAETNSQYYKNKNKITRKAIAEEVLKQIFTEVKTRVAKPTHNP